MANPAKKWLTFKSAERQLDSEIWKFRARVDKYSIES